MKTKLLLLVPLLGVILLQIGCTKPAKAEQSKTRAERIAEIEANLTAEAIGRPNDPDYTPLFHSGGTKPVAEQPKVEQSKAKAERR